MSELYAQLQSWLQPINSSKLFAGIAMLVLNIGSKYIQVRFSDTQEAALRSALTREVLIFAIVFTATRDLLLSIGMTAAFVVLSDHVLSDRSQYSVLPKRFWDMYKAADLDKDGVVTPEEEAKAIEILRKAASQKNTMPQPSTKDQVLEQEQILEQEQDVPFGQGQDMPFDQGEPQAAERPMHDSAPFGQEFDPQ